MVCLGCGGLAEWTPQAVRFEAVRVCHALTAAVVLRSPVAVDGRADDALDALDVGAGVALTPHGLRGVGGLGVGVVPLDGVEQHVPRVASAGVGAVLGLDLRVGADAAHRRVTVEGASHLIVGEAAHRRQRDAVRDDRLRETVDGCLAVHGEPRRAGECGVSGLFVADADPVGDGGVPCCAPGRDEAGDGARVGHAMPRRLNRRARTPERQGAGVAGRQGAFGGVDHPQLLGGGAAVFAASRAGVGDVDIGGDLWRPLAVVGSAGPLVGCGLDGVPIVLRQFMPGGDGPMVGQVQGLVSHEGLLELVGARPQDVRGR
jgi:hypothetical protein